MNYNNIEQMSATTTTTTTITEIPTTATEVTTEMPTEMPTTTEVTTEMTEQFVKDGERFVTLVNSNLEAPLDPDFLVILTKCAHTVWSNFYQTNTPNAVTTPKLKKKKKTSAFNVFRQEYKELNPDANKSLKVISPIWKELGDEGHIPYQEKADELNAAAVEAGDLTLTPVNDKPKKAKTMSGYQFFLNHLKETSDYSHKERVGQWGEMEDAEKAG